ncbi:MULTISPECIES: CaiB/BaiF CoA transferase family protein [Pseudonocardia]|uniref:Succinyl-CoA:(R)-benzylsuccinate CoA-transferase subunit BbsF n=2 Tax=Pseudonocardia TaxID=1847 RepID=A0A1Y2MNZ2_PSEAH|nr:MULTISPECIES: CaiB/BaiF CoA-transferase family protein [Pseudonocardia]OSY36964.1 Succinyl-CoA:(R)-benzylsuccinate CoA-transferase subunit BbsF [Pseudonocardia autotrophica]TDN75647.1 alpha-methylacyl-CoA racemase [Pseudonocardia autotrophica]BBF99619.1 alpha-methylacyl-CoA racemase [Pseudonocardia autotrophica]GEC27681.1 alpha-methylacyl-CoA racemase [Pseudonocardia saturnea]
MGDDMPDGPLHGIRVVEFAGLGPGPFAAMLLADAGADVIRVDRPAGPVDGGALTRGRPWIGLDLKTGTGHATAAELIEHADVLIEGFRPGVMERLRLGPETCLAGNPRLVYGRMTGWGQDGPRAREAGHDINYLAVTGALRSIARRGEAPVPPLNLVGDYGGGGMLLAFGITTALLERQASGRGQVVDAAMTDGVSLLMTGIWSRAAQGRWSTEPGTNDIDSGAPFYDVYRTADDEYVAVGAIEPQFWARLLDGLGLDPAELPGQWDRERWPELKKQVAEAFAGRTRAGWSAVFADRDACVTPVLSMAEAPGDSQIAARGTLTPGPGGPQPTPAPRLARTPLRTRSPGTVAEILDRWGVATGDRR